jgi:uncharacterized protein involved in response to NO
MTKQNYFLSQPHQPFFILGVVNAIVMMLIFALNYKGIFILQTENLNFHVYSLIFTVFTNVFTGFLFTTFPRFNQTDVINKRYYSNIFYYSVLGSLLFLFGSFFNHIVMMIGMITLFLSQIFIVMKLQKIYLNGQTSDKQDSFWILTAMYFGLLGHLLFLEVELNKYTNLDLELLPIAINISFYMYIIFLAFSVAQRMVPFFSHSFAVKNPNFTKIIFVMFILKSIFSSLDFKVAQIILDLLLGIYLLIEFRRWELPLFKSPAILWVLHLALFWLPTAFFLSAISLSAELFLDTSFLFLNVHLLALGFLTTLLIGFGTRVTLGHSGQAPHADKFATIIFLFIQVIVIFRALYSLNIAYGWGLNFLFDISFTAWLILFLLWGAKFAKILIFKN